MDPRVDALLVAFDRVSEQPPADLAAALRELPEPGVLPSPWETWTLIGLVRHHFRQQWVAELIRTRLNGSLAKIAAQGWLGGHPDGIPGRGLVPGLPEWEYYFHGCGCCFTHQIDGDAIDVDFWGDSADYFTTFFYEVYLDSLQRPEPPETRLRKLHPSPCAVSIAIDDLIRTGALRQRSICGSHPYRLANEVLVVTDDIGSLCTAWSNSEHRVWISAVIGDWLAADEAASGQPALTAITRPRAEHCRELRWERLYAALSNPRTDSDALRALADSQAPDLAQRVEDCLKGPPSGLISAALEIIGRQDIPRWCRPVHELFYRLDPDGEHPQPHLWITSLKFLLRHGYRRADMIVSLAKADRVISVEAVMLALEYAPELALPLIRKGLTSSVQIDRLQVAAILALINATWSRRELLVALQASDDQETTAYVRAALLESGDEEARKTVLAWEERNPRECETGDYVEIDGRTLGPFFTVREHWLNDSLADLQCEMEQLQESVIQVKDVVPPEPPRK